MNSDYLVIHYTIMFFLGFKHFEIHIHIFTQYKLHFILNH